MPITVMCDKDAPGAFLNEAWSKPERPIYSMTFAVGCVVSDREMNGYDDSDFYATYWDAEAGKFTEVCYASTRGWTYPNGAAIDATPEVLAKWEAVKAANSKAAKAEAKIAEAKKVSKGAMVEVFKGRKCPIGTKGTVFWIKEETYSPRFKNGYKYGPDAVKIGIRTGPNYEDVAWTYAANVKVIVPEALVAEAAATIEIAKAERKAALEAPAALDFTKAKSTCEQHAWHDVVTTVVPITVPEVSDEMIKTYLHAKHPASRGGMASLRTSNGVGSIKIDREAGIVTYTTSCTLCD